MTEKIIFDNVGRSGQSVPSSLLEKINREGISSMTGGKQMNKKLIAAELVKIAKSIENSQQQQISQEMRDAYALEDSALNLESFIEKAEGHVIENNLDDANKVKKNIFEVATKAKALCEKLIVFGSSPYRAK